MITHEEALQDIQSLYMSTDGSDKMVNRRERLITYIQHQKKKDELFELYKKYYTDYDNLAWDDRENLLERIIHLQKESGVDDSET